MELARLFVREVFFLGDIERSVLNSQAGETVYNDCPTLLLLRLHQNGFHGLFTQ